MWVPSNVLFFRGRFEGCIRGANTTRTYSSPIGHSFKQKHVFVVNVEGQKYLSLAGAWSKHAIYPVRSSRGRGNVFRSDITGMGGSASFKYTPMHGQTYAAPLCLSVYRLERDKNKTCSMSKITEPSSQIPPPSLTVLPPPHLSSVSKMRRAVKY